MHQIRKFLRNRKGAALVEYALLVAGIAIVAVAAVSILGHKTSDLIASSATIIPGVDGSDNNPMASGRVVETKTNADGQIVVDVQRIIDQSGEERLGNNLGYNPTELPALVVPIPDPAGSTSSGP